MYYSLIAEYRSVTSQSSTSLLSRPTLSPLPAKKVSPSRIADISRLLGTSIHPTLPTSYLECPTVKQIFHSVEGAHRNFLVSVVSVLATFVNVCFFLRLNFSFTFGNSLLRIERVFMFCWLHFCFERRA